MKKNSILLSFLTVTVFANAQNVGIGTSTPLQKLHVEGATFLNGNVGIGISTVVFPLSFAPALGDKISLWSNSTNSYGFGIQSSLLQIHTDISAADIAFGYGSSAALIETMRIKGNGNVGIGISNPLFKLDVRTGSINTDSVYRIGTITVLTTPDYGNLFIGKFSGRDNTGTYNTFSGYQTGYSNTTGAGNSFYGQAAGFFSTSGDDNSFFGRDAGYANTSGSFNSFFGTGSGAANTTGSVNSFFGHDAGRYNTTGNNNSFFGEDAGSENTIGVYNSFFGANAGQFNTEGLYNSFFGFSAGMFNSTGNNNSFFGFYAGRANTTGSENSLFGLNAGYSNTIGLKNSFYGLSAGSSNNSGSYNSFFGHEVGYANTTGNYNSFFGQNTGHDNTIGEYNSFFGLGAGSKNYSGNYNSFFGLGAGNGNTTGQFNTSNGSFSLHTNIFGSYNTTMGYNSDVFTASLTNATAIGANARADCSNCLVLGSVFGLNGATSGVNVGIGTTNPLVILHVLQGHSGNVSPFSPLVVESNTNTYINLLSPDANETAILFGKAENAASGGIVYNNVNNLNGLQFRLNGNSTKMELYPNGNGWLQGILVQLSDLRLKKDIQPLQNSLQKITQLNGYNYYWKNENADNTMQTGVLAQEVQKIFPQLVKEDKQGILAVNYTGLIPVLIESIKEQQKQIERLNKMMEKLLKQ